MTRRRYVTARARTEAAAALVAAAVADMRKQGFDERAIRRALEGAAARSHARELAGDEVDVRAARRYPQCAPIVLWCDDEYEAAPFIWLDNDAISQNGMIFLVKYDGRGCFSVAASEVTPITSAARQLVKLASPAPGTRRKGATRAGDKSRAGDRLDRSVQ